MQYQILITTSGTGDRLGEVTKYTNKALVGVGSRPSLSRIIEKYPADLEIVVTLGHFGDYVRDFLELTYPNRRFNFVTIDNYDGPGSSLVYSLLQTRGVITGPFIFQTCDTLVPDDEIPFPSNNWIGGFSKGDSSKYASVGCGANHVMQVFEKGQPCFDAVIIGLNGIFQWNEFFDQLQKIYDCRSFDTQLSDIHALQRMVAQGSEFKIVEFPSWLDIGNIDALQVARSHYNEFSEVLPKADQSTFLFDDRVVKFFSQPSVVTKRVHRAKLLEPFVPKIVSSKSNFYMYETVVGQLLSRIANEALIRKLLDWALSNLWGKEIPPTDNFSRSCREFYFDKTHERVRMFLRKRSIVDKTESINGVEVPDTPTLLNRLPLKLYDGIPCLFHGDFILDNILYRQDTFILLDWRDEFSLGMAYGDLYYDLAKLSHSFVLNHELMNAGAFEVRTGDTIHVDVHLKHSLACCQRELAEFVDAQQLDMSRISLLTPLIWLNMSPLHEYPIDVFLYYFGRLNLHKSIESYYEK